MDKLMKHKILQFAVILAVMDKLMKHKILQFAVILVITVSGNWENKYNCQRNCERWKN